nr:hypothetical protein [Tanacetum cinerariifolium]
MWRKSFVKSKPNIYKNVGFLPVSKSISKSRQAYNVMTNNINHFKQIVDDAWTKHSKELFRAPTALDMEILIQTCLMPLAIKTQSDSLKFVHELKQEMYADLKYIESLEKGIDELESEKAEFSDMYDEILQDCVSKDVMCSYLMSLSDLDALDELQCLYLHKVKECDCLALKLSNQTESVSKEVHNELVKHFAKVEKYSISLEIALQKRKEQVKNDTVWNEKASNVFRKEREQYIEIQDLKAQLQEKNIAISELKKQIEISKGKSVDTKFDRPSVVRQPNAQRIPKPSVFSNSLDRIYFQKTESVPKANVSEGLSKPVTAQTLPQTAKKAFAPILGYGDLVQGNVTINRVYYVEGLNHNLFSVGQFCDADLEVTFRKSKVLLEIFRATTTQAWLWHRRLSHLNFNYINLLSKKDIVIGLPKLNINGKKYILVIIDDYSRYTWTFFLRSKDETPEVLKDFLTMIQRNLQAPVITVRTDRGTEFMNKALNAFFKEEGIKHQTSTARTPEQNGIVERQNRTLIEAAQMMLSASQLPLFFWAEAIATASYAQNRSIIIPTHGKTPYHIINDRKPSIKHLHIFGCICYITRDGENLDKMKEKRDQCILVGYSTQSKGYRVYNKRTRMIVESIHVRFDEIKEVSETSVANNTSGLVPQRQKASDYDNPDPSTSAPSTHTNVNAEENNNDQAEEGEHIPDDEFTNPFCAPTQEVAESSSHNIGNSNVPTFNQPQLSEYRWTKDHPLGQVRGNPSRPVQTRRKLATDPEMCMYALTVSTAEPKNIKEAMADSAWIEAMRRFMLHNLNGFVDPDHPEKVYRLRKALFGLKQAPRTWYDKLSKFLTSKGFTKGLQIHQSPRGIFINQAKYTLEILHKHGMDKGQSIGTAIATKPKLSTDLSGNLVDQTDYRSKIGSLMYLTSIRPDVVHAGSSFELTAFLDADHAGCIDTRKSTSGGIQFLGDKLVSWMSKKQNCT